MKTRFSRRAVSRFCRLNRSVGTTGTTYSKVVRFLYTSLLTCIAIGLNACTLGIPDSDNTFKPQEVVPCTPIIVNGVEKDCLSEEAFERWAVRNIPGYEP